MFKITRISLSFQYMLVCIFQYLVDTSKLNVNISSEVTRHFVNVNIYSEITHHLHYWTLDALNAAYWTLHSEHAHSKFHTKYFTFHTLYCTFHTEYRILHISH